MKTQLNQDARDKARDLARKITVAHDLDPDIQEELYGHIEDKLLAYTSGEERISDEDAFILVREHFGDASVVKALLHDVHGAAIETDLARRLLVAAIATLASVQVFGWLAYTIHTAVQWMGGALTYPSAIWLGVCATGYLVPWHFFRRWKRCESLAGAVWYTRWSTLRLAVTGFILLCMSLIVPGGTWGLLHGVSQSSTAIHQIVSHILFEQEWASFGALLTALYLLANAAMFFVVIGLVARFNRHRGTANPYSGFNWQRMGVLCLALNAILELNIYALSSAMGYDTYQSTGGFIVWAMLQRLAWTALILAFCGSWIWWCDTPPRLVRTAIKTGLAWGALMLAYTALPCFYTGIALTSESHAVNLGVNLFQIDLFNSGVILYGSREANIQYFLPHLSTTTLFLTFFVTASVFGHHRLAGGWRGLLERTARH